MKLLPMKNMRHIQSSEPARVASRDPFHRLVDQAYRVLERPAPRHVPGCTCALCGDSIGSRRLAGLPARDWTAQDVARWCGRATGTGGAGRGGADVVSRTDRAVFRFLLPRTLEMVASGAAPETPELARAMGLFSPGRDTAYSDSEYALLHRFGSLLLDRTIHDAGWPQNMFETMHLLASSGWPLKPLLRQAMADPDLPAALARVWGREGRRETLFPGAWPAGSAAALCKTFVTPLMVERMMNFAMADETSPEDRDAATRTADLLLRST